MDQAQFQQLLEVFTSSQQALLNQIAEQSRTQPPRQQQQNVQQLVIPPFEHFDSSKENFKLYMQRFENYLIMRDAIKDKTLCHQMLINSIGSTHFKLMVSLVAPKKLADVSYDELVQKLEAHLCPKKNILVLQHRFLCTYQSEDQSLAEYVAVLRRDLNECQFVSTCECKADISNIFLRAQFIRGLKDTYIREQLIQSDESSFGKIMEKALSLEASKIDSQELNSKHHVSSNDVNKIQSKFSTRRRDRGRKRSFSRSSQKSRINFAHLGIDNPCIRCGRNNHNVKDCHTNPKKLKCRSCNKTGHVQQIVLFVFHMALKHYPKNVYQHWKNLKN
ncbi:uncharacterized protein LOC101895609 isoform X2 [Musca domestica]|uniref:Uncharacterized protein LOC101895609 isoform X2 n=1 Tax=Musca domestica TaxID=7370 RepID=A0ABM3VE28_MUSDO|nr:uncharacterized protein LOC101895609 isoform X2 [Musca domestica]